MDTSHSLFAGVTFSKVSQNFLSSRILPMTTVCAECLKAIETYSASSDPDFNVTFHINSLNSGCTVTIFQGQRKQN